MQGRKRREERLKQFKKSARAIGEEIEHQDLTEEQVDAQVEEVRQQLHQERYGDDSQNPVVSDE